jgi:purine-binding chemotaxis protein CheW
MLVDAVKEVFYLYQGEIEQSPSVGNDEALMFIQGVYQKDEELVILLDLNKMIDADNEQLAIGSMI